MENYLYPSTTSDCVVYMGLKINLIIKILVVFLLVFAFVGTTGCIRSFEEPSLLQISKIDIAKEKVKSSFVELAVTTYVENYGEKSDNASLLLKVYNIQTGLLEVQVQDDVGAVGKKKSASVVQHIELPKAGDYRIEAVLYEEGSKIENDEWYDYEYGRRVNSGELSIYDLENLKPDIHDIGIEISEMDFIVRDVDNGTVVIENDLYLINEGRKRSGNYSMLVKARELNAGLIADKEWVRTGHINPETTVIKSVELKVPDNYNYVVEALIWNNNTIVKRGEGIVQLNPSIKLEEKERIEEQQIRTEDFKRSDMLMPEEEAEYGAMKSQPGFGILLAISAIGIVAICRRRRYHE